MKRLLTVAAFALLACAGLASPTLAGSFGLFFCGRHCNEGAVCIRPYNAFSPVLYGDVPGYGSNSGCCGAGGCGPGAYGPIAHCHGCGNNGGQGGCGHGGCAKGGCGYGWGHQGGPDYRLGMVNLRGPHDTGYTGALNHSPPDGLGNGAFGNNCTGRLGVVGLPVHGGCLSCNKQNYWTMNTAPMTCGPQGCAPNYGHGMPFAGPTFAPAAPAPAGPTFAPGAINPPLSPLVTPSEVKPPLIQVPNKPKTNEPPQARRPDGYQAQPVSYMPNYGMPGQQMMPYGYAQPTWGYYGYQAPNYPAWGYRGW